MIISAIDFRHPAATPAPARRCGAVHVLIVPGLRGSGPAHWQSWLERRLPHVSRIEQDDWDDPDLERWSRRIEQTVARHPDAQWVALAHSFGCLALARHLARRPAFDTTGIAAALLVAPAEPARFELCERMPRHELPIATTLVASETDPWMAAASARRWARRWGAEFVSLGDAGHINADAGFGPWPGGLKLAQQLVRRLQRARRDAVPAPSTPFELRRACAQTA